ncbi:MSHA biogenesis protein MshL [Novimethylophilus kurashikiensis]|uniref:MSHA biogenesis protein MshL n=1 Tax=Novimethylophilus kurashikiensis TaxID=1825523 RepID=A0A2R5F8T2_9PROT|nr:hypothetical protein [Novimethylophilus kurashikiensis]GBG14607.1 MSHA biogenesis protein MshL [Novimethylophilus kurashikiensis]
MLAPKRAAGGLILAAILAAMTGCSTMHTQNMPAMEKPKADAAFLNDSGETELQIDWSGDSMFVLKRADAAAKSVPNIKVSGISFSEVGVTDAIRLMAAQAGLTARIEGGVLGGERYGPVSEENLSGTFGEVMEEMADAAGFFWEVKGKTLIIRQDDQFMVSLPPVMLEDNLASMTNTIQYLGGRDVYLDRASRTLTFYANRKGLEQIQRYMDHVRETRSLLVYDTHIFQVDLNDGMSKGINWSQLNMVSNKGLNSVVNPTGSAASSSTTGASTLGNNVLPSGAVGTALAATGIASTGAVTLGIAAQSLSLNILANFLDTQGHVESLSSPQLTMLDGSQGSFRVGKTLTFVSKVGSNTTTGISQVTTETTALRTGLSLQLQGDLYDKTVMTRVKLAIADVTSMDPFTAVGTQLTLPQTQDRDLDVTVRSRPGDMVLLGGIHINNDSKTVSRGGTGFSDSKNRSRSELVLVLKARVIKFVPKKPEPVAAKDSDVKPGSASAPVQTGNSN